MKQINVQKEKEFDGHKAVFRIENSKAGLRAFIAIHNDNRGPAVGGTRFFPYHSEKEALADVLRLSRGMTYKAALADLPHGGGKAVIIGNPKTDKNKELLSAYAEEINELSGQFFTGEDVGMMVDDVKLLKSKTNFIIGATPESDNPSYWTALGVFQAMQAALEEKFSASSTHGKTIAIRGLGKVGRELARLILSAGGNVIAADIDPDAISIASKELPAIKIVPTEVIHMQDVAVYSPCAMSKDLTSERIDEIKSPIVCGAANSQLATRADGERMHQKGILYIPDYLANAGGIINVVDELHPDGYSIERVKRGVEHIKKTAQKIIRLSKKEKKYPSLIADALAKKNFKA